MRTGAHKVKSMQEVIGGEGFIGRMKAQYERLYGEPFPEELPQTEPACTFCNDLGMYTPDVPIDHPDFGRPQTCPYCEKGQQLNVLRWERRLTATRLPKELLKITFPTHWDNLPAEWIKGKRLASKMCWMFCQTDTHYVSSHQAFKALHHPPRGEDQTRNSIVLSGDFGIGKTGLAAAVVNELYGQGNPVMFIRLINVFKMVQEARDRQMNPDVENKYPTPHDVESGISSCPVLVIDELGVESATDARRDTVENILRYRATEGLPTIVTTNLSRMQLAEMWGERAVHALDRMAHWPPMGGRRFNVSTDLGEAI